MLEVIDAMLQNESYPGFSAGHSFVNYAEPNKKFFDVVVKISRGEGIRYDISSLGKLYEINPDTMHYLYEKLKGIDEYKIALTRGYMLGGMGRIDPQKLWGMIDADKNPTTNEKISYACAIYGGEQKFLIKHS